MNQFLVMEFQVGIWILASDTRSPEQETPANPNKRRLHERTDSKIQLFNLNQSINQNLAMYR